MRLKLSRRHHVRLEEKSQLLSLLYATDGSFATVRTKVHFALRGNFPATEALANNTFELGTSGWTGSDYVPYVSERQLIAVRELVSVSGSVITRAATVVAYAPYVLRAYVINGRGIHNVSLADSGVANITSATTNYGLLVGGYVSLDASIQYQVANSNSSGVNVDDFFVIPYTSLTRCFLVDSGSNGVLQSRALDNAAWTATAATITANAAQGPDNVLTADLVTPTAAVAAHFVSSTATIAVPAVAEDITFTVACRNNGYQFPILQLTEGGGGSLFQSFNLSTGAVGVTTGVPAGWSNLRASIAPLGGNWYACTITARKTTTSATVRPFMLVYPADNNTAYAGNGTSGILFCDPTVAVSSVPTRQVTTTTTAIIGASQTGTAIYVKGLPASTKGLLVSGDWIEINGELKMVTAPLNSNASGLGYLNFKPELFRAAADNDPIIVADPMGKFLVSNIKVDNEFGLYADVSYDLEHIYD
jgi:hypothetical protein